MFNIPDFVLIQQLLNFWSQLFENDKPSLWSCLHLGQDKAGINNRIKHFKKSPLIAPKALNISNFFFVSFQMVPNLDNFFQSIPFVVVIVSIFIVLLERLKYTLNFLQIVFSFQEPSAFYGEESDHPEPNFSMVAKLVQECIFDGLTDVVLFRVTKVSPEFNDEFKSLHNFLWIAFLSLHQFSHVVTHILLKQILNLFWKHSLAAFLAHCLKECLFV